MIIGYARVSTRSQELDRQIIALNAAGCEKIYTDKISGAKKDRPGLNEMLIHIRKGDKIIVNSFSRIARSTKDLLAIIDVIKNKGADISFLKEPIDTSTPSGKLMFTIFAALAEFERDIIRERTKEGIAAAKAKGHIPGRPKGLSKMQLEIARQAQMYRQEGKHSVTKICKILNIARSTFYRYLEVDFE